MKKIISFITLTFFLVSQVASSEAAWLSQKFHLRTPSASDGGKGQLTETLRQELTGEEQTASDGGRGSLFTRHVGEYYWVGKDLKVYVDKVDWTYVILHIQRGDEVVARDIRIRRGDSWGSSTLKLKALGKNGKKYPFRIWFNGIKNSSQGVAITASLSTQAPPEVEIDRPNIRAAKEKELPPPAQQGDQTARDGSTRSPSRATSRDGGEKVPVERTPQEVMSYLYKTLKADTVMYNPREEETDVVFEWNLRDREDPKLRTLFIPKHLTEAKAMVRAVILRLSSERLYIPEWHAPDSPIDALKKIYAAWEAEDEAKGEVASDGGAQDAVEVVEDVFNFSPGPSMNRELIRALRDHFDQALRTGEVSMAEISHVALRFNDLVAETQKNLRDLLEIPDNFEILFFTSGASYQYGAIPSNFLPKGGIAYYLHTDPVFSKRAIEEAMEFVEEDREAGVNTQVTVLASSEKLNFSYIPRFDPSTISPDASYVYLVHNNTSAGTTWHLLPETNGVPLVIDATSSLLSWRISPEEWQRMGVLFAGSQKNLGIAGMTVAVVRKDFLERAKPRRLTFKPLNYQVQVKSVYHTRNTLAISAANEVLKWVKRGNAGVRGMQARAVERARLLYTFLDTSPLFIPTVRQSVDRSFMNIPFTLPTQELTEEFLERAEKERLTALSGHRDVGGLRASLYNGMPLKGVQKLIALMRTFEKEVLARASDGAGKMVEVFMLTPEGRAALDAVIPFDPNASFLDPMNAISLRTFSPQRSAPTAVNVSVLREEVTFRGFEAVIRLMVQMGYKVPKIFIVGDREEINERIRELLDLYPPLVEWIDRTTYAKFKKEYGSWIVEVGFDEKEFPQREGYVFSGVGLLRLAFLRDPAIRKRLGTDYGAELERLATFNLRIRAETPALKQKLVEGYQRMV